MTLPKIVLENNATLFSIFKKHDNYIKYKGNYYFHLHNEVSRDFGNAFYIENSKKVLGVSKFINSTLKKRFPNMRDDQFVVLRNAVDQERFSLTVTPEHREMIQKQYKIPNDKFIFLFSGRLTKEKGIAGALEAFKLANLTNAVFLIVGSSFFGTDVKSKFEEELEVLINEIGDSVIFTGYIPNDKMGEIYSIADVVVLPSFWDDPAPLTIIESMTAGKPIITTDSGGIPEYVETSNSIIVKRNDEVVVNLSVALKELYMNKELVNDMGRSSKIISSKMTTKSFYENFLAQVMKG